MLPHFLSKFIGSVLLATTIGAQAQNKPYAIYGDDNRQEMFAVDPFWQNVGRSIAGKVSIEHFSSDKTELKGAPLSKRVCAGTRFSEQITVPKCTGFLVKPNILVTAGHCMDTPEDCSNFVWVFGYALQNDSDRKYTKVTQSQIYRCRRLVGFQFRYLGGLDYAIIELDRPVTDRTPLALGFDIPITKGMPLAIIGHPNGIPMKFSDGAEIIQLTDNDEAFASNLDVFQGNSGSPVFDLVTGKVLGITSHGHADHVRDPEKLCKINKVCLSEDNCHWSVASRVTNMKNEPALGN